MKTLLILCLATLASCATPLAGSEKIKMFAKGQSIDHCELKTNERFSTGYGGSITKAKNYALENDYNAIRHLERNDYEMASYVTYEFFDCKN